MKPHTLPVKRRSAPKGILKRLSAVTANRKQRVAAAATASDLESDDGSSRISRALTIIFLIHIVAIALIFVHQKFLDGRAPATAAAAASETTVEPVAAPEPRRLDLPRLASGEKPYIVKAGDNYSRIAAAQNVDENDLRLMNEHVEIKPGLILRVPPQRILAIEPPEVAAIRENTAGEADRGLVPAIDVSDAPRAQLVRPNVRPAAQSATAETAVTASGKTYTVQSGDSIWRIANKFNVNQAALMKANGISDAKKMKVGMNLVIPR